jgi:hypothetical protein
MRALVLLLAHDLRANASRLSQGKPLHTFPDHALDRTGIRRHPLPQQPRAGKAERKVASKSGVNPDEANRGAFRPLLEKAEKPGAYSPFNNNQEQRALLAKIVQGDKGQNLLRGAGRVAGSPVTRGALAAGAGALGLSAGGIGALPGALALLG